jgi:hypothetical protein
MSSVNGRRLLPTVLAGLLAVAGCTGARTPNSALSTTADTSPTGLSLANAPITGEYPDGFFAPKLPNQQQNEVWLLGNEVRPTYCIVPAGTTVTWTNYDFHSYEVNSDSNYFHGLVLAYEGQWSFTFTEPGTYLYWIDPYTDMIGYVVVT